MSQPEIHVPPTIIHAHGVDIKNVFTTHEKLGQGGFAAVYRVTHDNSNKSYAIKVTPKDGYSESKLKAINEKLKNEIQIQKKLNHQNIVQSKLAFSDEKNNYIVLEYCPGRSIRDLLRKSESGRLSEAETRKILKDIINGLSFLHNCQIIHHDLKLENFLIGKDGKVKIADFGLAILMNEDDENNKKKSPICGTTNYLSPEIIQKKNKGMGFETDIWAVGVATFIMLTGKPPFEGCDKEMTYENIKNCNYQFPSKIQISKEAKDFVKSILKIDPHKRPTAIDLIDHPFLTKFDNEQIQLFNESSQKVTPIQKVQCSPKLPPVPIQSSYSPVRAVVSKITPSYSPRIRSFSGLSESRGQFSGQISEESGPQHRKSNLSNYGNTNLFYDHENNESNGFVSNVKKNFIVPNFIVTKHCFKNDDLGYLLADGTVGVCFDDKTRVVISPDEKFVQFYKSTNSYAEAINAEETKINEMVKSKISLVKAFAKSFKKFKYLYELEEKNYDPLETLNNVKCFVKKDDSILFKLSNKNIQVNFSDFKKLLIFWNTKKMCIFRVIKEKCCLMNLNEVCNMEANCDEIDKFKKAKNMLSVYDRKDLGLF